jgi:hypothetical protein
MDWPRARRASRAAARPSRPSSNSSPARLASTPATIPATGVRRIRAMTEARCRARQARGRSSSPRQRFGQAVDSRNHDGVTGASLCAGDASSAAIVFAWSSSKRRVYNADLMAIAWPTKELAGAASRPRGTRSSSVLPKGLGCHGGQCHRGNMGDDPLSVDGHPGCAVASISGGGNHRLPSRTGWAADTARLCRDSSVRVGRVSDTEFANPIPARRSHPRELESASHRSIRASCC